MINEEFYNKEKGGLIMLSSVGKASSAQFSCFSSQKYQVKRPKESLYPSAIKHVNRMKV